MIDVTRIGIADSEAAAVSFNAGDVVRVHVKIKEGDKERIQVFQGTVIQRRGAQLG